MRIILPKSKFNFGDRVRVKVVETGCEDFEGNIYAIGWKSVFGHIEYDIIEDSGQRSGGYTDEWLTLVTALPRPVTMSDPDYVPAEMAGAVRLDLIGSENGKATTETRI